MKKMFRILLPVVAVMLIAMLSFGVSAEVQLPEQCSHCGQAATWQALSTAVAADATVIPEGHYYVDQETINLNNASINAKTKVCIYMNGNTIEAAGVDRVFEVSGTLTVMGEGTVKGYGRDSAVSDVSYRYGGTVQIASGGVFNLYDATVTSEKITGSKASNGGNVNVGGTFNMYSGVVSNGYASNAGGNVFVMSNGKFNMYGGSITGGTCSAGKSVCAQGKVLLSGDASINELYLWNKTHAWEQLLTLEGVCTGTVNVDLRSATAADGMVVGTSQNANVRRANYDFDKTGLFLTVDGTQLKMTTQDPSVVSSVCRYCNKTVTWTALTETNAQDSTIAEGHYYLEFAEGTDLWATKAISSKVCLDLSGMTLVGETRVFVVQNNGILNIQGQGTVAGRGRSTSDTVTNRVGGTVLVSTGGTLNVYEGTLTFEKVDGQNASNGGVICTYGTTNIYGGTVKDGAASNAGSNIFVTPAGKLSLYSGVVSGGNGKSVYCQGSLLLSGDAKVNLVYMTYKSGGPEINQMLTIKDSYIGDISFEINGLTFEEGAVVGISQNADLRHAGISIKECGYYVVAQEGALKLATSVPTFTKEGYCQACEKNVTWTALMESFSGQTNIETGHYYLDFGSGSALWDSKIISGMVCLDLNGQTLTGRTRAFSVDSGSVLNLMGEGTVIGRGKSSSLEIADKTAGTILVQKKATLNQYGGTLTYEKVDGQNAGNGGILNIVGTYNLYDGEVKNGQSVWVGGNIFITTTGTFNMYGGKVSGGSASQLGNSVSCRGKVCLSGNASINELHLYPDTSAGAPTLSEMLTVKGKYTGTVKIRVSGVKAGLDVGSSVDADVSEATATTTSSTINGIAVHGKDLLLMSNQSVVHFDGTTVLGSYATFAEAMEAYTDINQKLVLFADVADVVLTKDIYVDLNGYNITGSVTGNGTLYCMDAHTDDMDVSNGIYGTVTAGEKVKPVSKGAPCTTYGYMMITEDGKASFHRIRMQITAVSLRPGQAGLYYSCNFGGDEKVKAQVKSFGMAVSVEGDPLVLSADATVGYTNMTADLFGASVDATSTLISGIMKTGNQDSVNSANAQTAIYGRTYVELNDGSYIYGECITKSLQDQVCGNSSNVGVERMWDGLTTAQKRSVMDMYQEFATVMSAWNIPTISGAVEVRDDAAEDILLERRAQVVAKMRLMGDLYWRATEDVKYHISSTARWVEFKAGRIYRGMPYAYARSDQNTFLEFALDQDEKGIYNIGGLTTTHLGNGSTYARIGNDCSGSVNFSWSSVGADISGTNSSRFMIEANGYYKVGDYEYTPTEDGRVGISKEIVAENGKERMYEAYAKVQPGDGLDTTAAGGGHVILVVSKKVVYNADGSINPTESYIHTLEQTPGPVSITVQQHSWNEELGEMVYDIYIEKDLTFAQCYSSGYLPITVKVLTDPAPIAEANVQDSLTPDQHTYENLLKGDLTCSRMISSVNLTVTDENGEVFSITGSGIRASIRKYYMRNFLTEDPAVMRGTLELDKLIPGENYHCKVTVQLASGDIIVVRDFDFTATDADISVPEGSEVPPESSEPEDDGEGVPGEDDNNDNVV